MTGILPSGYGPSNSAFPRDPDTAVLCAIQAYRVSAKHQWAEGDQLFSGAVSVVLDTMRRYVSNSDASVTRREGFRRTESVFVQLPSLVLNMTDAARRALQVFRSTQPSATAHIPWIRDLAAIFEAAKSAGKSVADIPLMWSPSQPHFLRFLSYLHSNRVRLDDSADGIQSIIQMLEGYTLPAVDTEPVDTDHSPQGITPLQWSQNVVFPSASIGYDLPPIVS